MPAWRFCDMLHIAERDGLSRFVTMQGHMNLLYREEEREMVPLCNERGVGLMPWSPLARGRLARPSGAASERARPEEHTSELQLITRTSHAAFCLNKTHNH